MEHGASGDVAPAHPSTCCSGATTPQAANRRDQHDERDGNPRVENGAPSHRRHEQAGHDRADGESQPERGVQEPEPPRTPGAIGARGDDGRRRPVHEAAGDALHHAAGQQPAERRRRRGDRVGDGASGEPQDEDRPVSDAIAERAAGKREQRVAEDVADDHPAHRGRGKPEACGHGREGDVHHRIERDHEDPTRGDPSAHADILTATSRA